MIITTSDNENIEVSDAFAFQSNLLRNMYQDLGSFPETLELRNITSHTLRLILEYYESRRHLTHLPILDVFFKTKKWKNDIVPLLIAADYLLYESLYQDTVRFVSQKYQDLNITELEAYFQ